MRTDGCVRCRCLPSEALSDMGGLLLEGMQSDTPAVSSNATLALACMPLCGAFAAVPSDEVLAALLKAVEAMPLVASAAASGLAVCLTGSSEFDGAAHQSSAEALFALVGRGARSPGDQQAAAAALDALGRLASDPPRGIDSEVTHDLLGQTFSLAVLLLQQLEPQCADVVTTITASLQPEPVQLTPQRTPRVDAALSSLEGLDVADSAPLACAAVHAVAAVSAALPAPQAEAVSPLLPALIKASLGAQEAGSAAYGILVGAVSKLPHVIGALQTAGLLDNASATRRLSLPERVAGSAADACVHRAAVNAQAQLAALPVATATDVQGSGTAAAAFVDELPGLLQRMAGLPRARFAASAPALALAALLGVLPAACPRPQPSPAGLLQDPSAESVAACKQALQLLERHTTGGNAKVDPLSAWLCALAARVRPMRMTHVYAMRPFPGRCRL